LQGSAFVGSFDGTQWTTHNTIELFEEAVGRIAVTAEGQVWGSTMRHGVVSFDGDEWREYTTADGLPSNQIIDLAVSPNGVVWAVTDYGVAYLDGREWNALDDAPNWITRIAFASDGTVWFGTSTGQVLPYQPAH
jgi:ligand-binding sensor domain-containing protein